ncbi:mitochondrial proton/calcium exchanger protein-like protein isoform X1 [Tanacetum coccineum]
MSKVLQERGFGSLPSSTKANPRDQVKSISTTIEADSAVLDPPNTLRFNAYYCKEKKGSYRPQFSEAYSEASQSIPQKEKDPWSFTLPCFINNVCFNNALVDLGASVSVMPLSTYLNLGLGELAHTKLTVELADMTLCSGLLNVALDLGRPFLSTTRAKIDVYKRKITLRVGEERIVFTSVKPASSLIKRVYMLSLRERMELDLEARLIGETLVYHLIPTIEEGEVIEEFRTRDDELNVGIDDYLILENMDAYRDEGMGDVVFGEPFLREVRIKTKRFEGMITIYNGHVEVTYQIGDHIRGLNATLMSNANIPPLLKCNGRKDE